VEGGALELATVRVPFSGARAKVTASQPATAKVAGGEAVVRFASPVKVASGEKLTLSLVG
jgi:hypothetical protein